MHADPVAGDAPYLHGQHRRQGGEDPLAIVQRIAAGNPQAADARVAAQPAGAVARDFGEEFVQAHAGGHQHAVGPGAAADRQRLRSAESLAVEVQLPAAGQQQALAGAVLHLYRAFVDGDAGASGELAHVEPGAHRSQPAFRAVHVQRARVLAGAELDFPAQQEQAPFAGIEADIHRRVAVQLEATAVGQGQAPARQAVLGAGLARGTPCSTLNKMCGSGMKALMLAHDTLLAGSAGVALAGGMESMSNAPYLLERARSGYRMGHGKVLDHMFLDGLEDAYDKGRLMGTFAEDCAEAYGFTREAQDEFAVASLTRAQQAMRDGRFQAEIVPLTVTAGKTERLVDSDEQPPKARLDKIPTLKPAFREGGTVTAANSSSISDGAAALVLMRLSEAERRGLAPLAAIRGHASFADAPNLFPTAPVGAVKRLMQRTGWSLGEVDLFEVNEAFAVVGMAAMRDLDLSHERLNVHGGACALGHPIGASGARIVVTLLNALQQYDLERGVAAVCIGGGEATAIAVERLR